MPRVALVDYELCNLDSIRRALEICGAIPYVCKNGDALRDADMIVLPGVGAFGTAMKNLTASGLASSLKEQAARGVPLLGICLGMQLLAATSEEGGQNDGLALIGGDVVVLDGALTGERVPHMGWNSIDVQADDEPLFRSLPPSPNFYFVHSYHFRVADPRDVIGTTTYCGAFASVVRHGNICGTQFHPEKSQRVGFQLLENFLKQ